MTWTRVFPNEDKTALMVLEWMLEAMHNWKILDPRGLEIDETQARDVYLSGQGMFTSNVGNVFPARQQSAAQQAGRRHPDDALSGAHGPGKGPMGWTRLYCIELADQGEGRRLAADRTSWAARTRPASTTSPRTGT